jgi:hypothetical protein
MFRCFFAALFECSSSWSRVYWPVECYDSRQPAAGCTAGLDKRPDKQSVNALVWLLCMLCECT